MGCIQGGPSVNLTEAGTEHKDVLWGQCPLDQQVTGCLMLHSNSTCYIARCGEQRAYLCYHGTC